MKQSTLITVTLVSALVLAACSPATQEQTTDTQDTSQQQAPAQATGDLPVDLTEGQEDTMQDDAMEDIAVISEMTIDMFEFGYSEKTLTASPGETITVTLTNSDGFHDFVIDELDVASEQINEGDEAEVTIVIPEDAEPGTEYEYYCSVGNHRAQGMVGTLMVK